MKIKRRDVIAIILGMISLLLIESAYDWEETAEAVKAGYNGSQEASVK